MKDNLVEVVKNQAVVSSVCVAESFGKRHDNVLRGIENLVKGIKSTSKACEGGILKIEETSRRPKMFFKSTYIQEQNGQEYPMYYMNRDGFTLLAMGFTGEKALQWKLNYIQAFNDMEKSLADLANTRKISKAVRRSLTDAIKECVPESPHKKFAYKNFTDLVYKTAFGKSCKKIKEDKGLEKETNLREFLSDTELKKIGSLEKFVDGCLAVGMSYEDIKTHIRLWRLKRLEDYDNGKSLFD